MMCFLPPTNYDRIMSNYFLHINTRRLYIFLTNKINHVHSYDRMLSDPLSMFYAINKIKLRKL